MQAVEITNLRCQEAAQKLLLSICYFSLPDKGDKVKIRFISFSVFQLILKILTKAGSFIFFFMDL